MTSSIHQRIWLTSQGGTPTPGVQYYHWYSMHIHISHSRRRDSLRMVVTKKTSVRIKGVYWSHYRHHLFLPSSSYILLLCHRCLTTETETTNWLRKTINHPFIECKSSGPVRPGPKIHPSPVRPSVCPSSSTARVLS
ncbi:hypothetical protein VTJ04DRAFT_7129 [Mycothermus thermophilus]|uniref:uncharacterized protein n=1 Tax=Humicola insolens TaxID=85995 RepID=UPI003743A919